MLRTLVVAFSLFSVSLNIYALEGAVKPKVTPMESPETYMLVGNSYTYYSSGLNNIINGLAKANNTPIRRNRMVTIGGSGLGWFSVWELVRPSGMAAAYADPKDGGKIKRYDFTKEKVFDAVVLQDNSAGAINPQRKDAFEKFAKQHSYDLRCFGIQPLLMMTWARKNQPEMTAQLAEATTKVGNEGNAMVIPVGLAFVEAIKLDPKLELFRDDQTHPSPEGTYLAGCVTFATMFHQSPVDLPFS